MRIRWLGPERRRQLLGVLQRQVGGWSEEWSVVPDAFKVELSDDDPCLFQETAEWHWQMVSCSAGTLHLGVPLPMLAALGGLLAQAAVDDPLGLGGRVAKHALRSLVARLTGDDAAGLVTSEAPTKQVHEARFGWVGIDLTAYGFHAVLWLDGGVCDVLCPPALLGGEPLHQREAALGSEMARLDVVIDLGSTTVNDTSGLRVGEVLVSRTPLKNMFHLVTPDGRHIARGNPCRSGVSLAVQIEST